MSRTILFTLTLSIAMLAGCSPQPTEDTASLTLEAVKTANQALVEDYVMRVVNQSDVSNIEEMLTEDFSLNGNGTRESMTGALVNAMAGWRAAMPDYHMSIDHITAGVDMVAIQNRATGTHQNKVDNGFLAGVEPSGKTCEWTGTEFFVIRDGKLASARITQNLLERDSCFGLVTPAK